MEKIDEVIGEGNNLDFGARIYDSRLGRFLSIDPFFKKNPKRSSYIFADNIPIKYIDYGGLYKWESGAEKAKSPKLDNFLKEGLQTMLQDENLKFHLMKLGKFSEEDLICLSEYGEGPEIRITGYPGDNAKQSLIGYAGGAYIIGTNIIELNTTLIEQLNSANPDEVQAAMLAVISTLIHESVHYGRYMKIDPNNEYRSSTASKSLKDQIDFEVRYLSTDEADEYSKACQSVESKNRIWQRLFWV